LRRHPKRGCGIPLRSVVMPDPDKHGQEPTQKTKPKKGDPVEIPVPKVSTIRAAIRKVAKPDASDRDR
jgi:hypothetical protein